MKTENVHPYTNDLIHETSPYLLQHAHNPVNWMPWNNNSLQKAKAEDKLIIISIGYSACHWCHVMEHESFEDTAVANLMNENFICIKVDREERPDVDQVYMDAVQLISGRGGWPLNAIALSDGRPVYAGTYFPKENWKQVLLYFVDYWKNKKEEAFARAAEITNGIRGMDTVVSQLAGVDSPKPESRNEIFQNIDSTIDYEKGGRRGAPKFPMPVNYKYLLRNYFYTKNEKALRAVTITLDNMMNGGIYDQIGGGFARYSVDAEWAIPHFEKMLYDNAQLVSLYSEAYQITKNARYKETVYETLDFVERELSDTSGGFYSALDADSEGEEGKFYVWTYDDLQKLLGKDFKEFETVFAVSKEGNFEGMNNLVRNQESEDGNQKLSEWKTKLLAERSKRVRPALDDKILTSWNALMLKGYIDAYNAFGEERFLNRALQSADFIKRNMLKSDFSLNRNYKNGKSNINGFLDDYSFTIEAFIALYETNFDEQWLQHANALTDYVIQHFYNINTGTFFYTSVTDDPLIARKSETSDNVIPASNSAMGNALYRLGILNDKQDYKDMANRALQTMKANMTAHPTYYANWAILHDYFISEPYQIAVVGEHDTTVRKEFGKHFLPGCIFSGGKNETGIPLLEGKFKQGETLIYVCRNKICKLPVRTVDEALKQMN